MRHQPLLHRFPKWLLQESFTLHFNPEASQPFTVTLPDPDGKLLGYPGHGHTIVEAAKEAHKLREVVRA